MSQREPRPRPDLPFPSLRKFDRQARGDESTLARREHEIRLGRGEIEPRGSRRPARRQREVEIMSESKNPNLRHATRRYARNDAGSV